MAEEPAARLFQYPRGRYRYFATLILVARIFVAYQPALAADLSAGPENGPEAACTEIKGGLHALADAEHEESFALDLAASGGSTAIVEARLSALLDRTQDLRATLQRVRQSAVARDPMVEQCSRMGFRALVVSEKLTSDVETVLFGGGDSLADDPQLKANAPAASPSAPPP
jgi:hypothetical protein